MEVFENRTLVSQSGHSPSGTATSGKFVPVSRRAYKVLKDYKRKLIDFEIFNQSIEDWVVENTSSHSADDEPNFPSPFAIEELRQLDLALEGVLFQQLFRMPCSPFSDDLIEDEFLALEDFFHAIINGLWRTFWHKSGPLPFFISCPRHLGSKFYTVEKAISRGKVGELQGLCLISRAGGELQVRWDQVVQFTLFKPNALSEDELKLSARAVCEALFYGLHLLISRSLSKISTINTNDSVSIFILDSKYGGVVKLGGDLSRLDINSTNPYHSAVEWMRNYAQVSVSPVDRIWNKLGNANWGDLGTLQILLATFYSIIQWHGLPRKPITSLASDHSLRLHKRWMEFRVSESENTIVPYDHPGEIVEVEQMDDHVYKNQASRLKLRPGEILVVDDQRQGQKSFQVQGSLVDVSNCSLYTAVSVDYPAELLTLYVGAHVSKLEPSWEDMSLWYQVQRQTKVLNILKLQGISSRCLPEIIASGRILHSGPCKKQTSGGRCDHPWCGTPVLLTSPVGEPLSCIVARDGPFSSEEAIRCCRDCLAALRSASLASVQHGDICPENIIRVVDVQESRNGFLYIPISWGRAVLEDRDSPAVNLQFSSSHALQHGKLCPSSDAESLIYLLYFVCGGSIEQQDSIESALQWRETSWAKRIIQQRLGEVSALLKAFADYVDSLCGTPYMVDYDVWLKRLSRVETGKTVEEVAITLKLEDVAESSGTSAAGG
ncbi:uncharacterized protein LOC111024675 isoform X2 [Momordica charantia]|uniref:Uncharacterized protein LOC111024675 isoform X2 n=1 Tax=Momordica charantia TaxID=3673 RepID=A0A6J1DWC7_MOMCH|nr:uncharacterized protein LOC111024675 isoform X2 [Momordica charantia]